ncbi:purine or other phosphorylase family 1 [Leadbetterella byssophila DSM 17132]|uniref:Uridine phosphorylase n=1 Tax=Leadbetterella byssophila (strain DSM 17132 / JCM 16389 / KACC 11308 / NBRC 106382 / 4M15) TaxID=649349 RepID=E4RUZ4_LEAB4|nr:nucleoside phosphorylase [Leadbetterella byssophila]ADQ17017.1 purine or other phosphorylase family 1 [Leadbetterella byssophila DSM 17132]
MYKNSELILNPDGSLYHINLKPEHVGETVFLVGDPDRVPVVSAFFDQVDFKTQKREIVTHSGKLRGKRVTVISTGMGTDNIDIVLGELDAAVNLDLEKKEKKADHTSLKIIRLGTSGSLQAEIPVDSLLASSHGLGLDGLLHFYQNTDAFTQNPLIDKFITDSNWNSRFARPYIVPAGQSLLAKTQDFKTGITATACGFYGPQGRVLRLDIQEPELNEKLTAFEFDGLKITNFEMETSAIYGLAKLMGHEALSVNTIIANRITGDFSTDYKKAVKNMIGQVLETFI